MKTRSLISPTVLFSVLALNSCVTTTTRSAKDGAEKTERRLDHEFWIRAAGVAGQYYFSHNAPTSPTK